MSEKIRSINARLLDEVLANYYVRVLHEELAVELGQSDAVTPIEKSVIIRDPRNFVLSHPDGIVHQIPEKEVLRAFFFSAPGLLNRFVERDEPIGEEIFNALLSLIRSGELPARCDRCHFSYRTAKDASRRSGQLVVHKAIQGQPGEDCTLLWELRGVRFVAEDRITTAALFVRLHVDEAQSTAQRVEEIIDGIDMPVQHSRHDAVAGPCRAGNSRAGH
jgi:hypothetical protein